MESRYILISAGVLGIGLWTPIHFTGEYQRSLVGQSQIETILARTPTTSEDISETTNFARRDTYEARVDGKLLALVHTHGQSHLVKSTWDSVDRCNLKVYEGRDWKTIGIDTFCEGRPDVFYTEQRGRFNRRELTDAGIARMEETYLSFLNDFIAGEEVLPQ